MFHKSMFNKSDFGNFFINYVISQVIAFALYGIPIIFLAPIIGGTLAELSMQYADTYAPMQDPVNKSIEIFLSAAFFICFSLSHLYRNKGQKLQFQKETVEGVVFKNELLRYWKNHGIADLVYYVICSFIGTVILDIGLETLFLWGLVTRFIRYLIGIPMYALVYTAALAIVLKLWDKKRPAYLKQGYKDTENIQ